MSEDFGLHKQRSEHFELAIQRAIDRSSWKPPKQLRDLRGQTLKIAKRAVTDIDAIGLKNGVLLAVDGKSFRHKDAYVSGEYGAIKNVADNVAEAREKWRDKIQEFENTPKGDNYDFTSATSFIAVYVRPHLAS